MRYWLTTLLFAMLFASLGLIIRQDNHIYKQEVRAFLAGNSSLLKDGQNDPDTYEEVLVIIHNSIALKAKPQVIDNEKTLRFEFESLFEVNAKWAIELAKIDHGYTLLRLDGIENYQKIVNCTVQH
jgi:hypothetical protein